MLSGYSRAREPESQPLGLSLMPGAIANASSMTVTFQGHYDSHPEVVTIGQGQCGGYRYGGDRTPEQVWLIHIPLCKYQNNHRSFYCLSHFSSFFATVFFSLRTQGPQITTF